MRQFIPGWVITLVWIVILLAVLGVFHLTLIEGIKWVLLRAGIHSASGLHVQYVKVAALFGPELNWSDVAHVMGKGIHNENRASGY